MASVRSRDRRCAFPTATGCQRVRRWYMVALTASNEVVEKASQHGVRIILVPVDFTPYSQAAVEYATQLASALQGELLILHVYEGARADNLDQVRGDPGWLAAAEQLGRVRPTIAEVPYVERLVPGRVVDQILDVAEREHVAMIVMGAHGRRPLSRALIGSVTEAVVRRATCPVAVVKLPG